MNRLTAITLTLLGTVLMAHGAPRFALVRVTDIHQSLPATLAIKKKEEQDKSALLKDERAERLRKFLADLQAIQAQLQDKKSPMDDETRRKLARDYEIKRQEAQTLHQEFETFRAERTKAIDREMVTATRKSLDNIVAAANKLATEQGYDGIFDSSGNTNTGVPFVLFTKSAPDLTDAVKAAIKDTDSTPAPPAAKPKSSQKKP